jgi:5'-nucleotidase
MQILVTNDDGVDAPGIAALAEVASHFGEVTVVAPSEGVSSCGHHVTTHRDLHVKEVRPGWFSIDGFPADCVRVGITALVPDVDLVLSGINEGGNLGIDLLMSGTASAAREARLWGRRGVAISQYKARRSEVDWKRAARWTRTALEDVLARATAPMTFWNINLPDPQAEVLSPPLVECRIDSSPLSIGFSYELATWRYASRYQERPRVKDLDVDLCFGGAMTLSAAPVFFHS